jgi:3-oxoacyl-(acyl-carrier-protein) synthase
VYLSHETFTHASDASSCAANEIFALRRCFGDSGMEKLTLLNTKGYTGHPMGVSFEDVAAVQILRTGVMPPVANLDEANTDPYLGKINLGKGTCGCVCACASARGMERMRE